MKSRLIWFNIYLISCVLVLCAGCETAAKRKKEQSTIALHLEVSSDGSSRSGPVPIYRANPVYVNVDQAPFLTEAFIKKADVIDALGGFQLRLEFDRHGIYMLDQYSSAYRGRRVAIVSQFPESRWLGAPVFDHRITNGVLVFTPDATRAEADRIASGLNKVAEYIESQEF